jgi:hypothetical protein
MLRLENYRVLMAESKVDVLGFGAHHLHADEEKDMD